MRLEFPLHLKRGQRFHVEGRNYTVHSRELFEDKDPRSYFHNKVGIETTVGTFLVVPVNSQVELGVYRAPVRRIVDERRA
jgi:hypothetical protein